MDAWFAELFDDYLGDEITLSEFWNEFFPAAWDVDEPWVYGVKLRLYEYSSAHHTKEELKEQIEEIIVKEGGYEGTGERSC